MKNKTRILVFDIETAPLLSYTWGLWEQNVIDISKQWYILSFSAKWLGEKKIISKGLPDYKTFTKDMENDKELVADLWKLMDEADVVIAHNGNSFDVKKANARFIAHGMTPPSDYKKVDTKLVAKRYFKFDSNSLKDLAKYLKVEQKMETGGFQLWKDCMIGKKEAWKKMLKYNKQDVVVLEQIYLKLRPWMDNHPNINILDERIESCPICGSNHLQSRGFSITRISKRRRFQCQECAGWSTGKPIRTEVEIR